MTIDEAREHIGEGVVYLACTDRAEDGVITSVSDRYVFVRYVFVRYDLGTSKATRPEDLTLLAAKTRES
jgi:hypothetical protein